MGAGGFRRGIDREMTAPMRKEMVKVTVKNQDNHNPYNSNLKLICLSLLLSRKRNWVVTTKV